MTAEQKLEKCKELVERWRKEARIRPGACCMGVEEVNQGRREKLRQCADELQAILEEDDE